MIDEKFLEKAKERLKKEEIKLVSELSKFADRESDGDYTARYVDLGNEEDDNIQEYREYDFNLSLEKKLEDQLANVRRALRKIKDGKYGICEKCQAEIGRKRLEAYPAAPYCIKCADDK